MRYTNKKEQKKILLECRKLNNELWGKALELMDTVQVEGGTYPNYTKEQAELHKNYSKLLEHINYAGKRVYKVAFGLGFEDF